MALDSVLHLQGAQELLQRLQLITVQRLVYIKIPATPEQLLHQIQHGYRLRKSLMRDVHVQKRLPADHGRLVEPVVHLHAVAQVDQLSGRPREERPAHGDAGQRRRAAQHDVYALDRLLGRRHVQLALLGVEERRERAEVHVVREFYRHFVLFVSVVDLDRHFAGNLVVEGQQ